MKTFRPKSKLKRLEDNEEIEALRNTADDIQALTQGKKPAGWKTWAEFKTELEAL